MTDDQRLSSGYEIDATEGRDHALRPKKLDDFMLDQAQKSQFNSELYNSVLDLSRLLLKYAK